MNHPISLPALQLLSLVRSSLWQKPTDVALFSKDDVDWQKIAQLALQQTVGILTFEAALSMPKDLRPPKEWINKALVFMEGNRRTHILVDRCAAEAVGKFKEEGIEGILLKGQAYARAYPQSYMRQCGDIDLYVGECNYLPAYEAVKSFEWRREKIFSLDAKHYGCWLNGVRIELHRIAGQLSTKSANRKFQQWSSNQLSISESNIPIAGKDISVPTPLFDIVFVFLHMYHHFLNGGIGLRHICDWTMLLHAHSKEIDVCQLEQKLKDYHLIKAWSLFTPIAVDHLGLKESECPFYSPDNKKKSDRILAYILREGNFGRALVKSSQRPDGYLAGKAYSFFHHTRRLMPKLWIDPNTLSRTYVSYVIKGLSRVIKDIKLKISNLKIVAF